MILNLKQPEAISPRKSLSDVVKSVVLSVLEINLRYVVSLHEKLHLQKFRYLN